MIALENTTALLLCAGHSRRFAGGNKLMYPLSGKAVVAHIATILASLPFVEKFATVRAGADDLHQLLSDFGFALVLVPETAEQNDSVNAGLETALRFEDRALFLALGDMPFVTAEHITKLAASASMEQPAASQGGNWTGPPWIASAEWVQGNKADLKASLNRDAVKVAPPTGILCDIDTMADLTA